MIKCVTSDVVLDINDGDTVSKPYLYCAHGIAFSF